MVVTDKHIFSLMPHLISFSFMLPKFSAILLHLCSADIKPFECYEGAVYVLNNDRSVGRTRFVGVNTVESGKVSEEPNCDDEHEHELIWWRRCCFWFSAPTGGPSVLETVQGNEVKVNWTELPRSQQGGCISNYTIYIENIGSKSLHPCKSNVWACEVEITCFYADRHVGSSAKSRGLFLIPDPVSPLKRMHVIHNLGPAIYRLWMTAWTAKGEGPASQTIKFFIQRKQLSGIL